jgi:hypothetical protein
MTLCYLVCGEAYKLEFIDAQFVAFTLVISVNVSKT